MKKRAVILLLLWSSCIAWGRSKTREDKKKKYPSSHEDIDESNMINVADMNMCNLQSERQINLFCYCDRPENASDANCWLFNSGEAEDAPVWDTYRTQKFLTNLKFHVRAQSSLTFVPTKAFRHTPMLKTVEIVYANIETVESFAFANLTQLQDLELTRNQIVTLRPYAFSFLPHLKVVTLGENRIAELTRDVFVELPSLTKLYMDRNNLSLIHDRAFSHLHQLKELELHSNYLSVVTRETFTGLKSLTRLELHGNRLTMLGDYAFLEMPALEELLVDSNWLEAISPNAFRGLHHLNRLALSDNRLTSLPPSFLQDNTRILYLDLRDNQLHTLSHHSVEPLLRNIMNSSASLYLDGNELRCDCRLAWMHSVVNSSWSSGLRNTVEELTCYWEEEEASPLTAQEWPRPDEHRRENHGERDDETDGPEPSPRPFLSIPHDRLPCPLKATQPPPSVELAANTDFSLSAASPTTLVPSLGAFVTLLAALFS